MRLRTCFLLLALLVAASAQAERADREKEIVVGADHLTGDDINKTSTFEGNVVVTQGTMRITAARVTMREDPQKFKYYVATGAPVTFRQKRDKVDEWVDGEAQRAEFDDRNDILKLYTHAHVKSGANEITGDFISYDMRRELTEVSGAPPGAAIPQNSRVKVTILPPKREADKAPANPPLPLKQDAGKP